MDSDQRSNQHREVDERLAAEASGIGQVQTLPVKSNLDERSIDLGSLRMMRYSTLVAVGLQVGAVVLGYLTGVATDHKGQSAYGAFALFGMGLMMVGAVVSHQAPPVEGIRQRTAVCVACFAYAVGVVYFEPFLFVYHATEIVRAGLVLVPVLLAIGYLVRGQAWAAAVGVALFVYAGAAMIADNVHRLNSGSGFIVFWRIRS